jgi:HEPN domain-containing protein
VPVIVDQKWATFAEEDFRLVEFLWNESTQFYGAICFHAQQFVEKIFKGVLEGAGAIPPRTHDINALAKRLAALNILVPLTEDEILLLSSVYIDTRYPPDVGLLPDGGPTQQDVDNIFRSIQKIAEWTGETKEQSRTKR